MGASTSPMTGAMRRSDSCSSTIPGRSTVPPGRRSEDAIEPDAGQIGMARPAQPRRPRPESTGRLAAGRADDLLQGFARERLQADQPKSRGACPHQAGETLRPPRHEPVDRSRPQGRSRPGRRILAGIDDAARVVALIEAAGLARAGTVCCQPVEHDVEKQPQTLRAALRGHLAHRFFGRSGDAQPWVGRRQIGNQEGIAACRGKDRPGAEMVETQSSGSGGVHAPVRRGSGMSRVEIINPGHTKRSRLLPAGIASAAKHQITTLGGSKSCTAHRNSQRLIRTLVKSTSACEVVSPSLRLAIAVRQK